jgi:phosphoglycolate phosphatase
VSFTVGFDLDMTLIDPRSGMVELFDALAAESGIPLDGKGFVTRLGPPLAVEFARYGCTDGQIEHLIDRYRALYREMVIPSTVALPGAAEAVRSVGDRGGRTVVVSAKLAAHVQAHLDALGIEVAAVVGELWSSGKASALIAEGAEVYVGDHVGDVEGGARGRGDRGGGGHRTHDDGRADDGRGGRGAGGPHRVPGVAGQLPVGHRPLIGRSRDATVRRCAVPRGSPSCRVRGPDSAGPAGTARDVAFRSACGER